MGEHKDRANDGYIALGKQIAAIMQAVDLPENQGMGHRVVGGVLCESFHFTLTRDAKLAKSIIDLIAQSTTSSVPAILTPEAEFVTLTEEPPPPPETIN